MEVLEFRCSLHCVVEMGFQSAAFQQTVGHLRQVNPNYGIWISKVWQTGRWKFSWRGWYGLPAGPEEQLWHCKDVHSEFWFFARAAKCLLPEFGVVGMGQHLASLLCVVFTEKPAIERNVSTCWRRSTPIALRLITTRKTKCQMMARVA